MPKIMDDVEAGISAFLHNRARQMHFPVSGTFELTSRCNFNCKMCYIHDCSCSARDELSTAQWLNIAKEACDMGMLFLLLTGGEPLLREDFEEIYSKVKAMGTMVSINTNGSLLNEEKIEFLKKDPPTRINISLYGASNETYKNLTGGENFDRTLYNIKKAKAAGLPIKLNLSITPYNACDIDKIIDIANELDVYIKSAAYLYPPVRRDSELCGVNDGRFSPDEAAYYRMKFDSHFYGKEKYLERVERLKSGVSVFESECIDLSADEQNNGMLCRAGSSTCWINYRGEMTACGIIGATAQSVLENGFKGAWEKVSRAASEIRLPKECTVCKYRPACNVCAAVCLSETGEFGKVPEYVCEFTKSTVKYAIEESERLKKEI